jgi:hypothetical protein
MWKEEWLKEGQSLIGGNKEQAWRSLLKMMINNVKTVTSFYFPPVPPSDWLSRESSDRLIWETRDVKQDSVFTTFLVQASK